MAAGTKGGSPRVREGAPAGIEIACPPQNGQKKGSRSERGAQASAILYTLVQTAKLSRIEPKTYLRLAALRAQRGQAVVLPHEVTEAHLRDDLNLDDAAIGRVLARQGGRASRAGPDLAPAEAASSR